jgi:geranylgeranyl diphosphate synthase type I
MIEYFAPVRDAIVSALSEFLAEKRFELDRVNTLGVEASDRLREFALQGKMIRGCLVSLGSTLAGGGSEPREPNDALVIAGAAMELFQSGLLIHDDIMDRDRTRRGKASVFQSYADDALRKGSGDAYHLGESLGICLGDISFFLAFELLGRLDVAPSMRNRIMALCSRELSYVGAAQMQDVFWGGVQTRVGAEEILRLYTFKTGRYTFSLPLMAGGMIAAADDSTLGILEKLGEQIGILFQIRDDALGLFGEEAEIGKPAGSDVKEGKKTLYHALLMASADREQRNRLLGIFGNRDLSQPDLGFVRDLTSSLGVREAVREVEEELVGKARSLVGELDLARDKDRQALLELVEFTLARTR